jgi:hypothetical protein
MSFTGFSSNNSSGQQQFVNSKNYNTNTSHPLIPNSQEYIYYKKYVSIHSEDRDMLRYPSSSSFEIELPEDLLNVASLRLFDWAFPCNYNTFSSFFSNTKMTFKIDKPYDPNINNVGNLLIEKIFECLYYNINNEFEIEIEDGFYNPIQMATELTNKFNTVVTNFIITCFNTQLVNPALTPVEQQEYQQALDLFNTAGGYTNFIIVYNSVGHKLWFGNTTDGFLLTNETQFINSTCNKTSNCTPLTIVLPDYALWGLPSYLGFNRNNEHSLPKPNEPLPQGPYQSYFGNIIVPRFYYGDALTSGDNGYWLLPNTSLPGSVVHWIEPPFKINLMGPPYMYMEMTGQNCIDETSPYNISNFTLTTNKTNGVSNNAFAKICIPATPISQWFDKDSGPYKFYYPPAERMRKFHFKLRYHNGQLVDFGTFNFSFTLEFTLQLPQILRDYKNKIYPDL